MAKTLGQRPSQLIELTRPADGWLAACFDTTCVTFGRWVDSRLAELDDDYRPKYRLAQLLNGPPERPARGGKGPGPAPAQGAGWAQARQYRSPRELPGFPGQLKTGGG